ncbi:hypothetical protein [Sphingomonas psychrotolerans]|nr:hypothetical protein [Sphingomonas psychrotolerans]
MRIERVGGDDMVDFAAAVADPHNSDRLDPRFDPGDHLPPNAAAKVLSRR